MSGTQPPGDTRYLFKRDKTWWVKLAVPRQLRDVLGYDLRRSLHTHDLEEARATRWDVIEEFHDRIETARAEQIVDSVPSRAHQAGKMKKFEDFP